MKIDSNKILTRQNWYSTKWCKYSGTDIIPLWLADMDFQAAEPIKNVLAQYIQHGIFGYSQHQEKVKYDIKSYLAAEYHYLIDVEDLIWLPGVVAGLHLSCMVLSSSNEGVIAMPPIYPPFLKAPINTDRQLITVPLIDQNNKWQINFSLLEEKIAQSIIKPKLLLLCNPHNPVGRMWNRDELEQLLKLVLRYDLFVCADEIHCDLILKSSNQHVPFASLCQEAANRTITLMSPSKTYNLAGLNCAFAIIHNPKIRGNFIKTMTGLFPDLNIFGLVACQIAFTQCGEWKSKLLIYLRKNLDLIMVALSSIDGLKINTPEATYLLWIDGRELCKRYQIDNLQKFFEVHGVGLSDGVDFGLDGFVRLNFGTTHIILVKALERIKSAINYLKCISSSQNHLKLI